MKIFLSFMPVLFMAGLFIGISDRTGGERNLQPLVIAAVILVVTNVVSLLIRRFTLSGRIAVDQMQGTVTFVPVGGRKTTLHTGELASITISPLRKPDGTPVVRKKRAVTILGLSTVSGDGDYRLTAFQGDPAVLRGMADELSVLTSVTVREEA